MHSKTVSMIFSAGLVAALAATPASALDLGMAGGGTNSAGGALSSPAGNLGGNFANSWQGAGNASAPLSMPSLPSGGSALATPATPAIPSLTGAAGGNATGALAGGLPGVFSGAGNLSGDGSLGFGGVGELPALPAASAPAVPSLPTIGSSSAFEAVTSASGAFAVPAPAMPGLPTLPAASLPGLPAAPSVDVTGAVSSAVNASVPSLPGLPTTPALAAPAIPSGIDLGGSLASTDVLPTDAVSVRVGYSASANGSGIALPALPSLGMPASQEESTASTETEAPTNGGISVSSTIDAAVQAVRGTVATATDVNGSTISNAISITPTVTAIADGVSVPSLPTFSGSMPSLALPGSSIEVTSSGQAQAGTASGANGEATAQSEPASEDVSSDQTASGSDVQESEAAAG